MFTRAKHFTGLYVVLCMCVYSRRAAYIRGMGVADLRWRDNFLHGTCRGGIDC